MSVIRNRNVFVLLALTVLATASLQAAMVKKMDLGEVCDRAELVFRGTVLSATEGAVTVGGGELPTMIYTFKVAEGFKGEYLTRGDETYARIEMLGNFKPAVAGDAQSISVLPELPQLRVGEEYVLMTTAPSAVGLSVPVGVAQGVYSLTGQGKFEVAENASGASLSYADLANLIRAALGQ